MIYIFVLLGFLVAILGWFAEHYYYNRGRCRKCKKKLMFFDIDSQGGRGYRCSDRDCGHTCWVSWPFIDGTF